MLTVHHLGVSQSERIVWLCEELGLDYELKRYDRDPQTRLAPAAYKALHPMGTAPVITDGTVVMSESGAIVEYILARYGKGRLAVGPEQPNFADYVFWLHFANGSMMPHELIRLICSMLGAHGLADTAIADVAQRQGLRAGREASRRSRLACRPGAHGSRHHDGVYADDDAHVRST